MNGQISNPKLSKPFAWDLVTVLDPRVSGRTLQLWLVVREFLAAKPKNAPDYDTTTIKRVIVSPMMPSDPKSRSSARENMSFAVVDARYSPQVVEICFTPRQAELFRTSFATSKVARPVLTAVYGHIRFKCYIPGCKATSIEIDDIGYHFLVGVHGDILFEREKVQVFRVNGPNDPAVLRAPAPFVVLPSAVEALEGRATFGNQYARSAGASSMSVELPATAGMKRVRGLDSGFEAPVNKVARIGMSRAHPESHATNGEPSAAPVAGGVARLLEEYKKNHPVIGEVLAEDEELFCICLQPKDDGRMIKCSNGEACRLQWYHPECIGMTADEVPASDAPWYCPECLKVVKQGKRVARAASVAPLDLAPRKVLQPRSARARAQRAMARDMEELGDTVDELSDEAASPEDQPWSADMVSGFDKDEDNIEEYGLGNFASAKATLRARAAKPLGQAIATRNTVPGDVTEYSSSYKSPTCRSWTREEEEHLKEVVKECNDAGLSGEGLWAAVHPRMVGRGVNRPVGGMKMRWCRGLREETKIDERRKKNKNLLTALQKPKADRDPDAPKKGRFKGKAYHEENRASVSSSATSPPVSASYTTSSFPTTFAPTFPTMLAPTLPTTFAPALPTTFASNLLPLATASFPITAKDVFGNGKLKAAHKRSASF